MASVQADLHVHAHFAVTFTFAPEKAYEASLSSLGEPPCLERQALCKVPQSTAHHEVS